MFRWVLGGVVVACIQGCASYGRGYQIGDAEPVGAASAERTLISIVNADAVAVPQRQGDVPFRIVHAPQPVMSRADVFAGVSGQVSVAIHFDEDGHVERTEILSSTKDSLSAAVIDAVSRWRIVPPVIGGRNIKFEFRQDYVFKSQY